MALINPSIKHRVQLLGLTRLANVVCSFEHHKVYLYGSYVREHTYATLHLLNNPSDERSPNITDYFESVPNDLNVFIPRGRPEFDIMTLLKHFESNGICGSLELTDMSSDGDANAEGGDVAVGIGGMGERRRSRSSTIYSVYTGKMCVSLKVGTSDDDITYSMPRSVGMFAQTNFHLIVGNWESFKRGVCDFDVNSLYVKHNLRSRVKPFNHILRAVYIDGRAVYDEYLHMYVCSRLFNRECTNMTMPDYLQKSQTGNRLRMCVGRLAKMLAHKYTICYNEGPVKVATDAHDTAKCPVCAKMRSSQKMVCIKCCGRPLVCFNCIRKRYLASCNALPIHPYINDDAQKTPVVKCACSAISVLCGSPWAVLPADPAVGDR